MAFTLPTYAYGATPPTAAGNPYNVATPYYPTASTTPVAPAAVTPPTFTDPATVSAANTPTPGTGGVNPDGTPDNLQDMPWSSDAWGWNPGTIDLALSGVKTIGGLWTAWQENKLAKEQLKLSRDTTNVNLANQISAYNTALEDKTRHRASYEQMSTGESDAYLKGHRLANRQI